MYLLTIWRWDNGGRDCRMREGSMGMNITKSCDTQRKKCGYDQGSSLSEKE